MGKFGGILRTILNPLSIIGDKIGIPDPILDFIAPKKKKSSSSSGVAQPKTLTSAQKDKSEDDAARRTRLAEKRRKGRRASVLSNIDEEGALLATLNRPGAS